jgi:hypothetical protein
MSTVTALADWLRANRRRREPEISQENAVPEGANE